MRLLNKTTRHIFRLIAMATLSAGTLVYGQDDATVETSEDEGALKPPVAEIKRLENGDILLGNITLHRNTLELSFPAHMNLTEGPLEVIIATLQGRLHESLLRADVHAFRLQTMLYLIGLNNGSRLPEGDGRFGDLVNIDIQWTKDDGAKIRAPIEEWIYDTRKKQPMERIGWVFVGSEIEDNTFLAEAEGNLVLIYSVGSTVLDIPSRAGIDDTVFVVNKKKEGPARDESVTVFISKRKKDKTSDTAHNQETETDGTEDEQETEEPDENKDPLWQ